MGALLYFAAVLTACGDKRRNPGDVACARDRSGVFVYHCTEGVVLMPGAAGALDYEVLRVLLTEERLGSYLAASGGDISAAFVLYEWNMDASAAAISLSAMVEVVLRNALDRSMERLAQRKGWSDWLDAAPLDGRALKDVRQARERASRGRREPTHGRVVAELSLGFWRYLMSRRYLTTLWIPTLHSAFPGATGDARTRQRALEGHVEQLLYLRNRAAHHEPIHRRDLGADLARALELAASVHPVAADWIRAREQLSAAIATKPVLG